MTSRAAIATQWAVVALVVLFALWVLWTLWEYRHERVDRLSLMTRPWQTAALIVAVIFGIHGFLAWEGNSNSKPEIAFVALAIIGYLVVAHLPHREADPPVRLAATHLR